MKKNTPKMKKRKVGRPVGSTNSHDFNVSVEIQKIIDRKKRFVHQREIKTLLAKKIGNITDPKEFARTTSTLIYSLKTRNKIAQFSVSDSTRDKYYGKPEWLKKNKPVAGTAPKGVKV